MTFRYRYLIDLCMGLFFALGIFATLTAPEVNTFSIKAGALAIWSAIVAIYVGVREAVRQEYESSI